MLNLDNLEDDMKKQPYGLKIRLLRLNLSSYVAKIINFAHIQISSRRALGFSIELHLKIINGNNIHFNDDGNLLSVAAEAVKIIYNLKLGLKKMEKINVIPIYINGLIKYMNSKNSMFNYLKPINKSGKIIQNFQTYGYSNLKRAIAEYAVMALSVIHAAEVALKNQQLRNH